MKKKMVMFLLLIGLMVTPAFAASQEIPILMYHKIGTNPNGSTLIVTPERFRKDMQVLKEHGYTALLTEDLIAIANGSQEMPDKPIMITFDDGYRDNYDYAYPI